MTSLSSSGPGTGVLHNIRTNQGFQCTHREASKYTAAAATENLKRFHNAFPCVYKMLWRRRGSSRSSGSNGSEAKKISQLREMLVEHGALRV